MIHLLRVVLTVLLAWIALLPARASAHEMSMAEMEVRELSRGEFVWQWSARSDKPMSSGELQPHWPQNCAVDGNTLHCGEAGLSGELSVEGVGQRYSAALVKVAWLDGQTRVYTLTASQETVRLYGSADDRRGWGEIASAYAVLGIEHILSGIDHLMFVICLLFLVGFRRRLLWTITAFTAAHSLTLGLSALGWLSLRSPPVEASIAMSIVLMASEALRRDDTLTRRVPAVVAFAFGLVHGLGFAGALAEIGLPQHHFLLALLTFNLGVELGQLLTVAACYALYRLVRTSAVARVAHAPALYSIGSVAAFWSIGRIVRIFAA